ncbi:MAG: hypothetical protein ACUVSW_17775 [Roseiflexus sp.]
MHPLPLQAFDHFTRVYDCVAASFEEMCRTTAGKLRRPATSIRWHFWLVSLAVFASSFFEFGRRIMLPLMSILLDSGVYMDGLYMLLLIPGFAGWIVFIALIGNLFDRLEGRVPIVLLVYSILILPSFPFLLSFLLSSGYGVSFQSLVMLYLFWASVSLALWLFIFGFFFMTSGGFPLFIFMILSSISRGKKDDLIPGYIHIVRHAAEKVQHDPGVSVLGLDDWRSIEAIARQKFDGVNGRVQTFSFGITALGFFGILALVIQQDEIRMVLSRLWEELIQLLGFRSSGNEGAVLLVILVGIIVLLAIIYFARSYTELRLLEAVGIIRALAIGNAAQQPVVQSEAVQPAGDAGSDNNAVVESTAPAASAGVSFDADPSAGVLTPSVAPGLPDTLSDHPSDLLRRLLCVRGDDRLPDTLSDHPSDLADRRC